MHTCALEPIPGFLVNDITVTIPPTNIGKFPFPIGPFLLSCKSALFLPPLKIPLPEPLLTPTNLPFLYHLYDKPSLRSSLYSRSPISPLLSSCEPSPTGLLVLYQNNHQWPPNGQTQWTNLILHFICSTSNMWHRLLPSPGNTFFHLISTDHSSLVLFLLDLFTVQCPKPQCLIFSHPFP